jgi:hypothetical protein
LKEEEEGGRGNLGVFFLPSFFKVFKKNCIGNPELLVYLLLPVRFMRSCDADEWTAAVSGPPSELLGV